LAGLPISQAQRDAAKREARGAQGRGPVQTATIHWQDVPLRDALGRLTRLFDEASFLDRRIDPTSQVNLDMSGSSAEQVLTRIAAEHDWGSSRVGDVVYLGPANAARQLNGVLKARREDVARLPQSQRAVFARKRPLHWSRLAEPRAVVTEMAKKNGWQLANAERIPHDLWAAGQLSGLTLAEQLAMLLIGFNLTYEIRSETRTIEIVDLDQSIFTGRVKDVPKLAAPMPESSDGNTKQVYSLRVAQQPVGDVIRALGQRLNWQIEFDEAGIQTAGLSLGARVSIGVENVEQDELLDAVLRPAGLTYRREGDAIKVVPRSGEGKTR
jgi:hypothetical protein